MAGEAPTVLVVDDNADVRTLVRHQLEARGWSVREASTGRDALSACRRQAPDLVLLDVEMPVLDGWGTLARLKAEPGLEHLPVIMLTRRDTTGDVVRGLEHGAHDYLAKPFAADELCARSDAALRVKREQDVLRRLNDELDHASRTDPVTGLANRRHAEERLAELASAGRRHRSPVAAVMFDIDGFKEVNDRHGHAAGDVVLRQVSARVQAVVRTEDFLARWGGDELVLVLPDTDLDGAHAAADRARLRVMATPIAIGPDQWVAVSVSGGCASGYEWADLVEAADQALYEAKRAGRDTVR